MFAAGVAPSPKFEEVIRSCPCDLSELSLREAIQKHDPARYYCLSVHPSQFLSTSNHVRLWTHSPLSLHINVVEDLDLDPFAWYLTANGRSIGSRGAT